MAKIEVGNPKRKIIHNKTDYKNYIKKNNGITNLYESVYCFARNINDYKPDYNSAVIDKMFFDFDSENSLINIRKFHQYLTDNNFKHYIVQSSYLKFHCFVYCKPEKFRNKKVALYNAQFYLAKQNNFSVGNSADDDLDKSSFGDIARLKAIPLTYKPKRKGWVSYISESDLNNTEILKQLTKKPRRLKKVYGSEIFNINIFDTSNYDYSNENNYSNEEYDISDYNGSYNEEIEQLFPQLIKRILQGKQGKLGSTYSYWRNRWAFTIFCRDMAFPKNVTDAIAKKYFSKQYYSSMRNKYEHYRRSKVIDYVYADANKYKFPSLKEFEYNGFDVTDDDKKFFREVLYK